MDTGAPVARMWVTDSWLRYEVPRLPWKAAFSQIVYWCHNGRLRPSCFSRIARLAAVSLAPRIWVVGSPGSRWTSMNTSTETTKDTTSSWRNRLRRYLPIKSAQTGLSIP